MAATSCDLFPKVNGEASKLYVDLLEMTNHDRMLTNYIYAAYLQQGVAAQMDSNYSRNSQGQHDAHDVYNYFNVGKLIVEQQDSQSYKAMRAAGSIDTKGNKVTYADGKQALEKANQFNDSQLGEAWVATVFPHGGEFQIYVERKDSNTQVGAGTVKEQLKSWDTITQALNGIGVDIKDLTDIFPDIFNPVSTKRMLDWLNGFSPSHLNIISQNDIKALLTINANTQEVRRLIQRWGDIDTATTELYDYLHNNHPFSSTDTTRMQGVTSILLTMGGLDVTALTNQVNTESTYLHNTNESFQIAETLKNLGNKINPNIIDNLGRVNKKITSLSGAAMRTLQVLERQYNDAKDRGDDKEALSLKKNLLRIANQIEGKCYYGGTLELLQAATNDISKLLQNLQNPPAYGSKLEQIRDIAHNHRELKDIIDNYYDIVTALSDLNKLIINDNIDSADEANLQALAVNIKQQIDSIKQMMEGSDVELAVDVLTEYLGDSVVNGVPIAMMATSAVKDTNFLDRLYSTTDISNPLVSAVSTIIRKAQQDRDKKALSIKDRIQRASFKLQQAGITNTDWMYTSSGKIISDIDWDAYEAARSSYRAYLISNGYKGYSLDKEMMDWEEQHTEDRVVDNVSGRTERVPNSTFRVPFSLTGAQKEYYDTMMQIKGELGTMEPSYARNHYTPPQIRMDLWDSLRDLRNYKGKNKVARVWKLLKEKFADLYTWREDEAFVDKTGYYEGGFTKAEIEASGTLKKRIPIFYNLRLKDQSMLDRNFGHALSMMTTTAVNYEAMNQIEDSVLFMKEYINNLGVRGTDVSGKQLVDIIESSSITMAQRIKKVTSASKVGGILEGVVDSGIYGMVEYKRTWWTKLVTNLIKFTSFSGLTFNVKGAITNDIVGQIQMAIEAQGGEFYTWKDWLVAQRQMFAGLGDGAKDRLLGTKTSLTTLLNERFNVQQDIFQDLKNEKFYLNAIERAATSGDSMILYGIGEYNLHQINMRAILNNEKVLLNGKKVPLMKVFEASPAVDGVSKLLIKQGATRLDGSPITEEYLDSVMNIIKLVNQEHHGAMAEEDKGLIHRYLWGKAIMNFRQWMVKHYARRFRGAHHDSTTKRLREGFYVTTALVTLAGMAEYSGLRFLAVKLARGTSFEKRLDKLRSDYLWKNLKMGKSKQENKMRIANVRKAIAEHAMMAILMAAYSALGGDDDDEDLGWWGLHTKSIIDRLLVEVQGSTPFGIWPQFETLVNKPIPSINTFNKLIYPITGISDITETYKAGRYKGHNKYIHKLFYEFIPFTKQIDYLINPEDDKTRLNN